MGHNLPNLKLWQINADRSRVVTDELRNQTHTAEIDILLIQEPYTQRGYIPGFGIHDRVITGTQPNEDPSAAIVIVNPDIDIIKQSHLSTSHVVCVTIITKSEKIHLVSAYFQYSNPPDIYIAALRRIATALTGPIILAADVNARSLLWGPHPAITPDDNTVENFILHTGWHVLNEPDQGPTYQLDTREHTRTSYIDITVITPGFARGVRSWQILEATSSSHRVLEIRIGTQGRTEKEIRRRYCFKNADWTQYKTRLGELLPPNEPLVTKKDVATTIRDISTHIKRAANRAIGKSLPQRSTVRW